MEGGCAVAPGYCITPMTEGVRNMPQLYEYLVSNTPQHSSLQIWLALLQER